MNGLDYAVIVLCGLGAIHGLRQGALRMVTSVVSLGAAIYLASLYHLKAGALAEHQLGADPTVAAVIGYIGVFAIVFAAVQIVGSTATRVVHLVNLGMIDRLAGSLMGAGVASVIAGLAVMLLAALLPANAELLTASHLAPGLLAFNDSLVGYIPESAKRAYEQNKVDLLRTWLKDEATRLAPPEAPPSPAASPSRGSTARK